MTMWDNFYYKGRTSQRNNPSKLFLLNSCKSSRKSPVTESDFTNVAGVILLKSRSVIDTFLRIHKEFRNKQATSTAIQQNIIKGFDLKSPF